MAKIEKFATIEEAASALGCEITDKTRAYLQTLVKSAVSENAGAKKANLLAEAEAFGLTGLDKDKETVDSLKVRIVNFLFANAMQEELDKFAGENNLVVDAEGKIFRKKAAIKPIEERNAGKTPGSVGALSIAILQDPDYAGKTIAELVELFSEFCEMSGYPGKKTTPTSLNWYVNYARKHKIEIIERPKTSKAKTAEGGAVLGAELTLEKALAPKGFAKKKTEGKEAGTSDLGGELSLDGTVQGEEQAEAVGE